LPFLIIPFRERQCNAKGKYRGKYRADAGWQVPGEKKLWHPPENRGIIVKENFFMKHTEEKTSGR